MNKIDRLYRKAFAGQKSRKAKEKLVEGLREVEMWFADVQKAYKAGKKMKLSDPDEYMEFIDDMERRFG